MTDRGVQEFLEVGAVTLEMPLTATEVAAAAAAIERRLPFEPEQGGQKPRYRLQEGSFDDPELLDLVQHPFLEEVAQRSLLAEAVWFFQTAIVASYPQPDTPFRFDQHVDIQYSLSDLNAVPRRMICSCWLWLTDVNERRAPLMYRPRSHWLIAAERERDPKRRGEIPRVAGAGLLQLPALDYAPAVPLVARAGQVSALTTAMVHGASVNVDTAPRIGMVITFVPAGLEIGLPPDQAEQKREYDRELRRRLRPERTHIIAA